MFNDLWLFVVAVVFVALNGLTQLTWAASMGFKMKPTAFAFLVGAIGNLVTGSVTPISGQSSILTISSFIKNMNERIGALLIAVMVMVPLGLTGAVSAIADFAGNPVVWGMMAGIGLLVTGISIDMFKQAKRTGAISFIAALVTWVVVLGNPHALVYVIAVSVTLASLDFVILQTDSETGKRGRRVNLLSMAKAGGYEGDMEQNDNPKFWTKEYWDDFKLMKPRFGFNAIYFALAFISLNIGANIAFGNITAGFAGMTQNIDHLTVINSLADIPSVLFGGAPVGVIISGTAAAPWPVAAGIAMMLLCAVLLLLGFMTRAIKYVPVQAIAGFLFIIGFISTFVPNLTRAFATGYTAQASAAMAVTAVTKNPFLGLAAGVTVRYAGVYFGI